VSFVAIMGHSGSGRPPLELAGLLEEFDVAGYTSMVRMSAASPTTSVLACVMRNRLLFGIQSDPRSQLYHNVEARRTLPRMPGRRTGASRLRWTALASAPA